MENFISLNTGFVVALLLLSIVWFISLIWTRYLDIKLEQSKIRYKEAVKEGFKQSENKLYAVVIESYDVSNGSCKISEIHNVLARSAQEALGEVLASSYEFQKNWLIKGYTSTQINDDKIEEAASVLTKVEHQTEEEIEKEMDQILKEGKEKLKNG